jgi:hypothetical protein
MRGAGIGLLSLLVVAAIIFIVMSMYLPPTLKAGKQGQDESQQISGHAASGRPAMDTIKLDEVDVGGSFRRVKVTALDTDSPYLINYHLQVGDEITEVGGLDVRALGDYGSAVAQVQEAYQNMKPISFQRGGTPYVSTPDGPLTQTGLFAPAGVTSQPAQ